MLRARAARGLSCHSSFQLRHALPEVDQGPPRLTHFPEPFGRDVKIRFGPSPAFSCGLAQSGRHEGLAFEAFQGDVDTAEGDIPAATLFNRFGDWHAVGLVL